jgi:uncharacterized protein (UPF0305 family)
MNTNNLLKKLQSEASSFDDDWINNKLSFLKENILLTPSSRLSIFNLQTILELKEKGVIIEEEYIVNKKVENLEAAINQYMDKYADGQKELKDIVRIVSVYRTFIIHKPLHPVEMFYNDGNILYRNDIPVCPLRAKEIAQKEAVCHFCNSTV